MHIDFDKLKTPGKAWELERVLMPVSPEPGRLREEDRCQFKASVGYIMSSKLVLPTV